MKITRKNTYDIVSPNIRRYDEDLYKLINGRKISFGQQVNSGDQNIDGQMVEIADTGLANTQFSVVHNLGRVPLFYDIKYMSLATSVFDSGTTWTTTQIFLKSSTAHVKLRIFVH